MDASGHVHHHRSGSLSQKNKIHKGASTRRVKRRTSGRVGDDVGVVGGAVVKPRRIRLEKAARRKSIANEARKRKENREDGPPTLVVLVALTALARAREVRAQFRAALGIQEDDVRDDTMVETWSLQGKNVALPRRVSMVSVDRDTGPDFPMRTLDAVKVADVLVLVVDEEYEPEKLDEEALKVLAMIRAQGVPTVGVVSHGSEAMAVENTAEGARRLKERRRKDKTWIRVLESESILEPGESSSKVHHLGSSAEAQNAFRLILGQKIRELTWRRKSAYLLAERLSFVGSFVSISGYLRGGNLSANRLIHITGLGTFPVEKVVGGKDPCPTRRAQNFMEIEGTVLSRRDPTLAEPVESEADPDPMTAAEQTWPPEVDDAEENGTEGTGAKHRRKRPKGWSEYQCAWIVDDGDENDDASKNDLDSDAASYYEEDEVAMAMDVGNTGVVEEDPSDEAMVETATEVETIGGIPEADEELDVEEIQRLREASKEEERFPDEVEVPLDQPAKKRFARYRGLKSLRTSPWDPMEQLPPEYARIFQFKDFRSIRKRVLHRQAKADRDDPDSASRGLYVDLLVDGLSDEQSSQLSTLQKLNYPIVISSLNQYENRRTVIHARLQRTALASSNPDQAPIIRSKDSLEFQLGFVRLTSRPLFSEDNSNSTKHKLERFFLPGRSVVASMYGPALFYPAPALAFKDGSLLASGSLLPPDPDRIILKRIVLTGYPFKVNKRRAVVRFMFFNPDDVRYFKPVELWTKLGRTGHITAPLGTHGYMKCIFDSRLLPHDTVCLSLYKRCFPKS